MILFESLNKIKKAIPSQISIFKSLINLAEKLSSVALVNKCRNDSNVLAKGHK